MSVYSQIKELLTPEKWTKEVSCDDNDRFCLLGAKGLIEGNLYYSNGSWHHNGLYKDDATTEKLAGIIKEQFPERARENFKSSSTVVYTFNDNNATTIADIHLILEKADADENV